MSYMNIPAFMGPAIMDANTTLPVLDESLLSGGQGNPDPCSGNASHNPSSYLTPYVLYRITMDVVIVGLMCLLGFVGNVMTIVILWSDKDKKSTTNWLLQSLAVVDIVYLVACVFIQPLKTIKTLTPWFGATFKTYLTHSELYVRTFASISQMITVWIVVLVTVDRYIAICHPLRSGKLRTLERARRAVVVVVIISLVYNLPLLFEQHVITLGRGCDGDDLSDVMHTDLRESWTYFLVYKVTCYFAFRSVGPLLVLMTLNARLMRALREMRRRHRCMTRTHRQRENVTLTLVVVVSVFILCELPDVSLRATTMVAEVAGESMELETMQAYHYVLQYCINPISNMLLTFNSAVNFLIYCLIGKKFRRILTRMCTRECCPPPDGVVDGVGGGGRVGGGGGVDRGGTYGDGCGTDGGTSRGGEVEGGLGVALRCCNSNNVVMGGTSQSLTGNSYALTNITNIQSCGSLDVLTYKPMYASNAYV